MWCFLENNFNINNMHKIFKTFFLVLISSPLVLFSCQENDQNNTMALEDAVLNFDTATYSTNLSRDTSNYAHLYFQFSLENPINKIEIIDNSNNNLVDLLDNYQNTYKLTFDYAIDITDIIKDSTLSYTVKVYDTKESIHSKKFSFNIKKFSTPQIILADGKELITDLPIYKIRAYFTTGSIPISKINLTIDGKTHNIPQPIGDTTEYSLDYSIALNFLKQYPVKIQIIDINGRQSTRNFTITRISEMEKPIKILCSGKQQYEILFEYDEDLKEITTIDFVDNYKFKLIYGQYNTAGLITQIQQNGYTNKKDTIIYNYGYDQQGRMQTLTKIQNGVSQNLIEQCNYNYTTLIGFSIGQHSINNIAYENFKILGKSLSEIWYTSFPDIQEKDRRKSSDFWTVKIPTYCKGIPNSMFVAHDIAIPFQDLFLSQYIHLKNINCQNQHIVTDNYSYTIDQQGRLSTLTRTVNGTQNSDDITYTYQFIYENTIIHE